MRKLEPSAKNRYRAARDSDSLRIGSHVRVTTHKPNGEEHPHAGKTGIIVELMGVYTTLFSPRAQVRIDTGQPEAGNIMIVSLACLEII